MRLALTIFFLLFAFICSAQKLIINSGLKYTETSTVVFNRRLGEGTLEYKKSLFAPDINILFETKVKNCLSIKSGFYIHYENYYFLRWSLERGSYWITYGENWALLNVDIPLLLSYEFGCAKRKVKFHTDTGPYIGFSKHDEYADQNMKKNDFGWEFLLGVGSEKWQFSSYIRMGIKNLAISRVPFNLEKAHAVIYGCNITRVINLKRKSKT